MHIAAMTAATMYSTIISKISCADTLLALFLFCDLLTLLLMLYLSYSFTLWLPALFFFATSMLIHIKRFVKRLLPILQNLGNDDKRQRSLHDTAYAEQLHARINRKQNPHRRQPDLISD